MTEDWSETCPAHICLSMDLLHLTFSSDFNAIPLRCPFHAIAIVQVDFADAEMFFAPFCFRVLYKVNVCLFACLFVGM